MTEIVALDFWRKHKAQLQALCAATGRESGLGSPVVEAA